MCFSMTASFTTAAILIPTGIYCLKEANQLDKPYWALAMLPLMFGIQQLFEGGVWFALLNDDVTDARVYTLGFLLFSHVIWLGWISYSSYLSELSSDYRRLFKLVTIFNVLFGLSMYIPLILNQSWLTTSIVNHSIYYNPAYIYDSYISPTSIALFYSFLILMPLILSSDRYHKILGGLIFLSGLISWLTFSLVFISVWCYFAAVISLFIFYIIASCVNTKHIASAV